MRGVWQRFLQSAKLSPIFFRRERQILSAQFRRGSAKWKGVESRWDRGHGSGERCVLQWVFEHLSSLLWSSPVNWKHQYDWMSSRSVLKHPLPIHLLYIAERVCGRVNACFFFFNKNFPLFFPCKDYHAHAVIYICVTVRFQLCVKCQVISSCC